MTRIVFRCDASLAIGTGHVMRCRVLARQLQQFGAEIIFLCRRQPGDLISLLEQEFLVLALPELSSGICHELGGRDLYASWLGCSHESDATDCLQALTQVGITSLNWLVVDHYGLDSSWQDQLLAGLATDDARSKILVIDDLADRPHHADLLLDQNFCGDTTELRYENLVAHQCRQLLGPHYALLSTEYAQMHSLVPKRTELRRLLVFFGGVDQENLTGRTLEALMDQSLAHLAVDVVLGCQSPHQQAVADLVGQRPFTTLHGLLPSLAGLIARADLAIGAGGTTTWERACLKLPSLVVSVAENQWPFAEALHHAGHLHLLGDSATVSVEQIRSALLSRTKDFNSNDTSGDLTDGRGVWRLAMAMLGPQAPIVLRPALADDEALLLRWANDPQVRASSFSPDLIAPSDHHNWFRDRLADHNCLLLIAMAADGCPLGQIRFDRQQPSGHNKGAEAMVGLSLDRCARGFGLAADLVSLGLQVMEQKWGPDIEAVAEVLTSNKASNACFSRAGFVQEPVSPEATRSQAVNRWHYRPAALRSSAIPTAGSITTSQI